MKLKNHLQLSDLKILNKLSSKIIKLFKLLFLEEEFNRNLCLFYKIQGAEQLINIVICLYKSKI